MSPSFGRRRNPFRALVVKMERRGRGREGCRTTAAGEVAQLAALPVSSTTENLGRPSNLHGLHSPVPSLLLEPFAPQTQTPATNGGQFASFLALAKEKESFLSFPHPPFCLSPSRRSFAHKHKSASGLRLSLFFFWVCLFGSCFLCFPSQLLLAFVGCLVAAAAEFLLCFLSFFFSATQITHISLFLS